MLFAVTSWVLVLLSLFEITSGAYQSVSPWEEFQPEEIVGRWNRMEKTLTEGTHSFLKTVIPYMVKIVGEPSISTACTSSFIDLVEGIKHLRLWAFQMLDSTGKPGGGQLTGSLAFFGDYDQCLSITVPGGQQKSETIFRGQYCLLDFRPPLPVKPEVIYRGKQFYPFDNFTASSELVSEMKKGAYIFYYVPFRFGVCLPSACSKRDVEKISGAVAGVLQWSSHVKSCEVNENKQMDGVQITILSLFGCLAVIVLSCTLGLLVVSRNEASAHQSKGCIYRAAVCFSLVENWNRFTASTASEKDETLSSLNGIRFISITWVVLGHTFQIPFLEPVLFRNISYSEKIIQDLSFQVIANSAVVVESFFFITGVLLSYHFVTRVKKMGNKPTLVFVLIAHRLWRLVPPLLLAVGLTLLLPLIGSGPMWSEVVGSVYDNCIRNGWRVPLLVNNLFPVEQGVCLVHTWYVSAEFQCFLLAVLFFPLYFRNRFIGLSFMAVMILISVTFTFYITWTKGFLPIILASSLDKRAFAGFVQYIHFAPQSHLSSYFIGMWLGLLLAEKKHFHLSKVVSSVAWIFSVTCCLTVVYSSVVWNRGRTPGRFESAFYSSLHRPAWTLSLAWLTYACAYGKAGFINRLLSWRFFTPLNRLTYLVFILHWLVLLFLSGSARGLSDTSRTLGVWMYLGNLFVSHGLAFIAWFLFQAPLAALENILLERHLRNSKNKDSTPFSPSTRSTDSQVQTAETYEGNDAFVVTRF